jgi:hypothetical protein
MSDEQTRASERVAEDTKATVLNRLRELEQLIVSVRRATIAPHDDSELAHDMLGAVEGAVTNLNDALEFTTMPLHEQG